MLPHNKISETKRKRKKKVTPKLYYNRMSQVAKMYKYILSKTTNTKQNRFPEILLTTASEINPRKMRQEIESLDDMKFNKEKKETINNGKEWQGN